MRLEAKVHIANTSKMFLFIMPFDLL